MLKFKGTYEILSPEDIGLVRADSSGIVLGKLSGRHALKNRLMELGYDLDSKELEDVFKRFKAVAGQRKSLANEDIEALLSDEVFQPKVVWALGDLQVVCGTTGTPTATVHLIGPDGMKHVGFSTGTGPVDAAYKAVDSIVQIPVSLLEYSLTAVTEGIDAIAHTRVLISGNKTHAATHAQTGESTQRTFSGSGAGVDVVVSSVRAYISALNKVLGFGSVKLPAVESRVSV
eukprot:TRINITY_DN5220_c0_g1_i1.p1 TRINITY_DN5220_c0_g1~~TRINITY_DN5220_c0_g1_i1.p1  ORF type:complete len:231 (+),score=64.67 TRINITY_DN5220_c0_g1_i1:94-786(+)